MSKQQRHVVSKHEAMRYSRQIMLPGFDLDKQESLLNSHVLQIGAGGLGSACASYLVGAGLGHLSLVDDDIVEQSNLQRQFLHHEDGLGVNKAVSAKQALQRINRQAKVDIFTSRLDDSQLLALASQVDLIVDCSDNLQTRNQLNRVSLQLGKTLVFGSAIRMEGQLCCFTPGEQQPCYQCLSHTFTEQPLSCMEAGIMSPVVGVIGSMQALEAIKLLTDFGDALVGKFVLFDGMSGQWQQFALPKHPNCPACGDSVK